MDKVERIRPLPYPVTYKVIRNEFQDIWTAWSKFSESQAPINDLFFEVISNHSRWSNQFLNLAQTLETYSCRNREAEAKMVFKKYREKNPEK